MGAERAIEYWPDGAGEAQRLAWAYDVHNDSSEVAAEIIDAFPPAVADLWDIAAACYAVDRRVRRPPSGSWKPSDWRRNIRVRVAVRQPALWERHRSLLEGLLGWLTCDRWSLSFRPGEPPLPPVQLVLKEKWPDERVAVLFSGGMDSTAGVLHEASQRRDGALLTVSVSSNERMRSHQKELINAIRPRLGVRLEWLPFRLYLTKSAPAREAESSQRTRGMVFLAAGIAAALTAGCRRLLVYETCRPCCGRSPG